MLRGIAAGIGGTVAAVAADKLLTGGSPGAAGGVAGSAGTTAPQFGQVPEPAVTLATLPSGVVIPVARWLVLENERPGTIDWVVSGVQVPHAIEGYASQVSATAGDKVALFINTTARAVSMQAFRMGYYQGLGARLVYQSDTVAGTQQRAPTVSTLGTVTCGWSPTLTFTVTATWPPGCYLLKIQGTGGEQQYVPLTVRDDTSHAAFVIQNSVTTWQAYNLWGRFSLYYGPNGSGGQDFTHRARIVSFDRPFPQTWAQGAADFIGNEYPLLYQLESYGADLTYWTDVDLHQNPQLLRNHQCLFSLGHDEYWSLAMRNGAQQALAAGTNLAFLGANACYRQIRFQSSPVGPNRQQICYKDATEDPLLGVNTAEVTGPSWESAPTNWPESNLIGSMYQSVHANDPLVIADASAWFFDGCNLEDGDQLAGVVQGEYDRYVPGLTGPRNVDVLAHSAVAGQTNWSDMTYYTVPGGGGVFASGMASFVFKLANTTAFPEDVVPAAIPGVTDVLWRAMDNLYGTFGTGPASRYQSSTGTWQTVYEGAAAAAPSAAPTPAA